MDVAIDLGGSTIRLFYKENERISKEELSILGNPLVNRNSLRALKEKLKGKEIDILSCAVAGGSSKTIREKIKNYLKEYARFVYVFSDIEATHYSFFGNKDGILVISGTGSNILIKSNGKVVRFGGLGYLLDDEGSGFWFGKEFIKQGILDLQANKKTMISKAVKDYFGSNDYTEILNKIYSEKLPSKAVADFGKSVANLEVSKGILNKGAKLLFESLKKALKTAKINPQANLKIALFGGMFDRVPYFKEVFIFHLSKNLKEFEIVENKVDFLEALINLGKEYHLEEKGGKSS